MTFTRFHAFVVLMTCAEFYDVAAIAIGKEDLTSCGSLTNLRQFYLSIPNADVERVDELINILNKCDDTPENFNIFPEILCWGTNITKSEQRRIFYPSSEYYHFLSKVELKQVKRKLNNRITPEQTERIMSILRKLTEDVDEETFAQGIIEFLVHAINRVVGGTEDVATMESVLVFFLTNGVDSDMSDDSITWLTVLDKLMDDSSDVTNHIFKR